MRKYCDVSRFRECSRDTNSRLVDSAHVDMNRNVNKDENQPDVVVTKKAFNLACSWVQKMSGGADFNVEEESKGLPEDGIPDVRPLRLGLGAKYLSHSQANHVSSQIDRKLRAKLVPMSKTASGYPRGQKERSNFREEAEVGNNVDEDEDEDEEDDSRTSIFKKRSCADVRPALIYSDTVSIKKKKKGN